MRCVFANGRDKAMLSAFMASVFGIGGDVIYIAEAFRGGNELASKRIERIAQENGYRAYFAPYNDADGRIDRHVHVLLIHNRDEERIQARMLWFGTRSGLVAEVDGMVLAAVHFDDRGKEPRRKELYQLLEYINNRPALIVGGLSETPPNTVLGRLLSFSPVARAIRVLPKGTPGDDSQSVIEGFGSHLIRLKDMTSGDIIETLLSEGFVSLDAKKKPTMLVSPRLPVRIAQLDYMMLRHQDAAQYVTDVKQFHLPRSYHVGLVADVPLPK